ncbi:MAG: diguanylate cyclase domain-containing protein [Cellulosilyticaceae bacterium]
MNENQQDTFSKTIGVVLGSFEEDCQIRILKGITDRLKNEPINLIIFMGATLERANRYNESYAMLAQLISSTPLDGLLLMGGAMSNLLSQEELTTFITQFSHIPALSISSSIANIPSLLVNNYSGIQDIVTHLIEVHGCTKIAFISGPSGHVEADSRLSAYQDTLTKYQIPVNPLLIVPGDFSSFSGENAIKLLLDQYALTDIEAFVCVDDATAQGVIRGLKARGYSIPNDFYVTGFDDIEMASCSLPNLTTVNQPFYELGVESVSLLLKRLAGQKVPLHSFYPSQMMIRESCGCMPLHFNSIHPFKYNNEGSPANLLSIDNSIEQFLSSIESQLQYTSIPLSSIILMIHTLLQQTINEEHIEDTPFWGELKNLIYYYLDHDISLDFWESVANFIYDFHATDDLSHKNSLASKYFFTKLTQLILEVKLCQVQYEHTSQYLYDLSLRSLSKKLIACFDMDSILTTIDEGIRNLGIEECYIGVYSKHLPATFASSKSSTDLTLIFSHNKGHRHKDEEGAAFCYEQLIYGHLDDIPPSHHDLFMPLFFNSEHFGYIVFSYTSDIPPRVFETLRSHISSGLKGAFLSQEQHHIQETLKHTLQQLEYANCELHKLSMKDELTGLLNRRGFMDISSQIFNISASEGSAFVLFYLDLDGLKTINDTFGHKEGDSALINLSIILKNTFRSCDVIARLGGDEFTLLASQFDPLFIDQVISRLQNTIDYFNQKSSNPYILSASIGYAIYQPHIHHSLEELMTAADKQLYKQKQLAHAKGIKIYKN